MKDERIAGQQDVRLSFPFIYCCTKGNVCISGISGGMPDTALCSFKNYISEFLY